MTVTIVCSSRCFSANIFSVISRIHTFSWDIKICGPWICSQFTFSQSNHKSLYTWYVGQNSSTQGVTFNTDLNSEDIKILLSETTRPIALIFGMKHHLVDFTCSNNGPATKLAMPGKPQSYMWKCFPGLPQSCWYTKKPSIFIFSCNL